MKTRKHKCLVIKHFSKKNAANCCVDNTSGVTSGVLTVACKLMTVDEVNETSIKDFCDFYGFDSTIVARELS